MKGNNFVLQVRHRAAYLLHISILNWLVSGIFSIQSLIVPHVFFLQPENRKNRNEMNIYSHTGHFTCREDWLHSKNRESDKSSILSHYSCVAWDGQILMGERLRNDALSRHLWLCILFWLNTRFLRLQEYIPFLKLEMFWSHSNSKDAWWMLTLFATCWILILVYISRGTLC